jgi:hypothetical protein
MSVEILEVTSKRDLKTFLSLPKKLYKDVSNFVPPLMFDEMDTFNPAKNPAYATSQSKLFLAIKDNQPVGRIACILSHIANKKYKTKNLRFGWFDTIEDQEVVNALFKAAENWGKEQGMITITGPQGFTDLDSEGMLIEGFDELPTIAYYYSQPYQSRLTESYGFVKEVDYHEFKCIVPKSVDEIPQKLFKLGDRVKERGGYRLLKFKSKKELKKRAEELFDILDQSFEDIYGSVPLTKKQVDYYIAKYFNFVDMDLIKAVVNEQDIMVGFIIALPSLSRAMQKAGGKIFPFGWYHLIKGLKNREILDFYLAGVKREYQGKGVDLLLMLSITQSAIEKGFTYTESNVELETNNKVQAMWKYFNPQLHKRRRIFKKNID